MSIARRLVVGGSLHSLSLATKTPARGRGHRQGRTDTTAGEFTRSGNTYQVGRHCAARTIRHTNLDLRRRGDRESLADAASSEDGRFCSTR